jgi:hypothetical protein
MAAIFSIYLLVSLALGAAWIAADLGAQPHRTLARQFLIVGLGWPAILIVAIGSLLLVTKSKSHDRTADEMKSRGSGAAMKAAGAR